MVRFPVMCLAVVVAVAVVAMAGSATAFYLPGVAPKEFKHGDDVALKHDTLTSMRTQLPYSYYELPFCSPVDAGKLGPDGKPIKDIANHADNLGEVLGGTRMETSAYTLKFGEEARCSILCRKTYSAEDVEKLVDFMRKEYKVNLWVDNLPGAQKLFYSYEAMKADAEGVTVNSPSDEPAFQYKQGYLVGDAQDNSEMLEQGDSADSVASSFTLNNHLRLRIRYHEEPEVYEGARIVGFDFEPFSVKHSYKAWKGDKTYLTSCNFKQIVGDDSPPQIIAAGSSDVEVVYSYDVLWVEDRVTKWSQRWDIYFIDASIDEDIHWFSIMNSLLIVFFLTGLVAMIMLRTLARDITQYNTEDLEELVEETGWKLVHGDVFRAPKFSPMLFSVAVGTGTQMMLMSSVLLLFACLGFLSPANRGGLITALLLLFVFAGILSGYSSAGTYKLFKGKDWKTNALLSAVAFPGACFLGFFVLNLFVWSHGSVGAIPIGTLIAIILLWFGVSEPLCFLGSYLGFRKADASMPCSVNKIPRQIPPQQWYMHPVITVALGGILPFGAVFIELFFIMSAVWLHQIYYLFGFLFIVLLILAITTAEVSIVLCYFQLCSEDYAWWWRSFFTGGSTGIYLFLYSIMYFYTKLEISDFTSAVLYFGYMMLISFAFSVLNGTIAFKACLWFNKKIYSSIKIE